MQYVRQDRRGHYALGHRPEIHVHAASIREGERNAVGIRLETRGGGLFVLIQDNRARLKSDAILGALEGLGGWFGLSRALRLVPAPIRDLAYDRMARNRYRLFGKSDRCMVPAPEFKDRFIGD